MTRRQRVLIIDDDASMRRWIDAILSRLEIDCVETASGEEGITWASSGDFDLILLDVHMPVMDGYAVASELKRVKRASFNMPPIIFLTGSDDKASKLKAFEHGAIDYVIKPFEPAELLARVKAVLRNQALMELLEQQASTDRLTGLLNRHALAETVQHLCRRVDEDPEQNAFALLFLDLDRFKVINDSLGHNIGDELLITIAHKLQTCVRAALPKQAGNALIARNGGDEFVVVLEGVSDANAAMTVSDCIVQAIGQLVTLRDYTIATSASVGVKLVNTPGQTVDNLLRDADTAMYRAKNTGKARAVLFDQSMHEEALARLQLEHELQVAIDENQIELLYQPIVSLTHNRIERFEALARWRHPQRGTLTPERFIPIAEETGLIHALGERVLMIAYGQARQWCDQFGTDAAPPINVNLSPKQLYGGTIVGTIRHCATRVGVDMSKVGIELTESTIVQDVTTAAQTLSQLRGMGIYLSIDDFGTGYSSMSTLRRFPFNAIKIDRAFVSSMVADRSYAAIIGAIVTLAYNLDIVVVAEGVETLDEMYQLQGLECDAAQGYLLSRPLSAEDATRLFSQRCDPFFEDADLDPTRVCWERRVG